MPRLYKFQGKTLEDGRLVRGDLVHEPDGTMIQYFDGDQKIKIAVDPDSVGQFTGFYETEITEKEPEWHEIYEGDRIVASSVCGDIYGTVRFGTYEAIHNGYYIDWDNKSMDMRQDLQFWVSKLKVIREAQDVYKT